MMRYHGHKEFNNRSINGKRRIFQERLKIKIKHRVFNPYSKREKFGTWFWTWKFDEKELYAIEL